MVLAKDTKSTLEHSLDISAGDIYSAIQRHPEFGDDSFVFVRSFVFRSSYQINPELVRSGAASRSIISKCDVSEKEMDGIYSEIIDTELFKLLPWHMLSLVKYHLAFQENDLLLFTNDPTGNFLMNSFHKYLSALSGKTDLTEYQENNSAYVPNILLQNPTSLFYGSVVPEIEKSDSARYIHFVKPE